MAVKSITDQILEIQAENDLLKEYRKLLDKALKIEYGKGLKDIEKSLSEEIKKADPLTSDFDKKITSFFGLKTDEDMADFLHTICTESVRKYFTENRADNGENVAADEQG